MYRLTFNTVVGVVRQRQWWLKGLQKMLAFWNELELANLLQSWLSHNLSYDSQLVP